MSSRPRLTPLLLGVLGFTGAVSPFATDMYLSSFGSIQTDLVTTASMVQLTLSVFFLGTAVGQLFIGPISDILGRRKLLLTSFSIYVAAGIALIFTPTIEVFIGLRLLLGFTGAAGIVLARAIAADLSEGETAVKALSVIAMMGGLGPLLAPPIGALTHDLWGWRGTLAALAALSAVMLILAWIFIPESLPAANRNSSRLLHMFSPLLSIVTRPRYVCFALAFGLGFTSMMTYISASPFVGLNVLGMTPLQYALGFAVGGAALISSNFLNSRIAPRFGPNRMLTFGVILLTIGTAGLLLPSLLGNLSIWGFITCAFILTAGAGFTMSNSSALALAETPHARGLGAALLGALQFSIAGIFAPVVGAWGEHTSIPMGVLATTMALLAAVCALLGNRAARR